ncbi:MAG: hypothetical protein ABSD58_14355 [Verrucomicrobiia bacterium]|jgi:hypothetical protein
MSATFQNVLAVLGLMGIGGLITGYFNILWQRQSTAQSQRQEFKFTRYKCILLLMYSCLDFEKERPKLAEHGRKFGTINDLLDELTAEWHNMILYSSDEAIRTTQAFITEQNQGNFYKAVLAMRRNLWGGKVHFRFEEIKVVSTVARKQLEKH